MKNMTFSREKFIGDEDFLRIFLGIFFGGEQGDFFGIFGGQEIFLEIEGMFFFFFNFLL